MKTHLKRIAAPKTWPIERKKTTFIARPKPSGQPMEHTLPVIVVMRDLLHVVENRTQAKRIMHALTVAVNGKRIYKTSAGIGFMDLLTIGDKHYRITISEKNRLAALPVKKGQEFTVQRIRGKTSVRGGKTQLNCQSGFNIIVEKDTYSVGDSIVVKGGKVQEHLPLQKKATVFVTGGSHIGTVGNVTDIDGQIVTVGEFQTLKGYAYVIGKEKPAFE